MSTIQQIKVLQAQGYSVSAIAQRMEIDRKTVRKYLRQQDFSPTPPIKRDRNSKVEPYRATIDAWLADDTHQWYKQRHTAQRVFDRLGEEFPDRDVSYRTIRRYVKSRRHSVPTTGTLDLVWGPGEGQVDFGQADVIEQGTRTRMHFLCLTFPYSNAGYLQLFHGETAECVVQGLVDIFQHIDGVPRRLVFDNATGVGRRVGDAVRLAELFHRCQAHYGFEVTFCNPYAGYEKGSVENKVGFFRRNLLVPIPVIPEVVAANREFLLRSERHWDRLHYQKGQSIRTLFTVDQEALRALPPQAFAPYRYTQVRTDRQGRFCLEGPHWYSSAPECAQQTITVRMGAHTVSPMAADGRLLTHHARVYGSLRSDSNDYRTTVHQVSQKPGAWRNSALRAEMSESVLAVLDKAVRADLQEALKGLAQSTDRWGFDHAVRALEEAVALGRTQSSDIIATAQRMALAPKDVVSSDVDLSHFDTLMSGRIPG